MTFDGALIREQGITFGIAVVQRHVLQSADRDATVAQMSALFGAPTVLMAQDSRGVPTFYGRPDIVRFLSGLDIRRIRWQRYTV